MPPKLSPFERRARQVRKFLRRYPVLQPLINRVGTVVWRWHLRRTARAAGAAGEGYAHPTRVRINPRSIDRAVWRREVLDLAGTDRQREATGVVAGGDWDERSFPLSDLGVFEAVRLRFEEGAAWEETPFHREIEAALARGEKPFKFKQPGDLARIFGKVEDLHRSISEEGYRSQEELGTGRPWDEVVIAFDRHGRPCFVDGRHRLAVARVLHVESIPAVVALRHERWADVATEIRAYADQRGGRAYQPYLHPDLADVPSDQGHERFELIRDALSARSGVLVDLGANAGYFSHRFEEVGFDCVAVERSEKEAYFLAALRDAAGRRFRIAKGSLTEVPLPAGTEVVLALNIFHHFLKTDEAFRELEAFLGRLDTRHMVLECHLPGDPQMVGAPHDMVPEELVAWVRRAAGFDAVRELGRADDGRLIFLLSG